MKKDEIAARNLLIGAEFDKFIIEHPELLDQIPRVHNSFSYLNTTRNYAKKTLNSLSLFAKRTNLSFI